MAGTSLVGSVGVVVSLGEPVLVPHGVIFPAGRSAECLRIWERTAVPGSGDEAVEGVGVSIIAWHHWSVISLFL